MEIVVQNPASAAQTALVAQAQAVLPAGTTNSQVQPVGLEMIIDRGEGPYLIDVDGRRFLDFAMGAGPLILGHAHPRISEAVRAAAEKGTHHFALHRRTLDLSRRLTQYIPSAEMVRYAASGSEATFHALRLARAVTGRQGIIKFEGAYHGHHDLAVWSIEKSASDFPRPVPASSGIQRGVADDVVVLPFNDSDAVREVMRKEPNRFAAVICEPLQRTLPPVPGFLETLRAECDRTGTVLIFDEIVTGFRLSPGSAQQRYGVVPDLTTLGKALAGGMPFAVIAGRRHLMEHFDPRTDSGSFSFHCGTFNGYLLAVEAAHTTLDMLMEEGGLDYLDVLGEETRESLRRAFADEGVAVQVCGDGPLFHAYFTDRPVRSNEDVRESNWELSDAYHRKLLEAGIYKTFGKGYLGTAHDSSHIEELSVKSRWALRQLTVAV